MTNVQRLWLADGSLRTIAGDVVVQTYTKAALHQGNGTPPPVGAIVLLGNSRYPKFYQVVGA
jgi:hypothetical protein